MSERSGCVWDRQVELATCASLRADKDEPSGGRDLA